MCLGIVTQTKQAQLLSTFTLTPTSLPAPHIKIQGKLQSGSHLKANKLCPVG